MTHTSIVANFSLTKKVTLIVKEEISYENPYLTGLNIWVEKNLIF